MKKNEKETAAHEHALKDKEGLVSAPVRLIHLLELALLHLHPEAREGVCFR